MWYQWYFVYILATIAVNADVLPVFIWSNDRSLELPVAFAGHTLSQNDFITNYVDVIAQQKDKLNIVLFIQDKMSLDDIACNNVVYDSDAINKSFTFQQLKHLLSAMSVAQLPAVESPTVAFDDLRQQVNAGSVHQLYNSPYAVDVVEPSLLIVHLPQTAGLSYRKSSSIIDDILDSVTKQMMAVSKPFVAIYTATQSTTAMDVVDNTYSNRQLLQLTENTEPSLIVNITNAVMLYAENVSMKVDQQRLVPVPLEKWQLSTTDCSANSSNQCLVQIVNNEVPEYENLAFILTFKTTSGSSSGYWYVSKFEIKYRNGSEDISAEMNPKFVSLTPLYFSYHCYQHPVQSVNSTGNHRLVVIFTNLQIQAFGVKNGQFGYYNDCVGFFSIPIWMGIISTAVLLTIVLFGIGMLMNINTMDRYDDPKGKTITVIAAD